MPLELFEMVLPLMAEYVPQFDRIAKPHGFPLMLEFVTVTCEEPEINTPDEPYDDIMALSMVTCVESHDTQIGVSS
jgi:hypothetical protein